MTTCQSYTSSPKKKLPNIVGIRVVGGKTHSSPWLIIREITYAIMVSVLAENNRYIIIHHHLSTKWCRAFNAAQTTLHTL
jgi:hypothetical protein